MNAAEIIIIIYFAIILLYGAYMHDEEKIGNHNFWVTLFSTILFFGLLYWAGLFH